MIATPADNLYKNATNADGTEWQGGQTAYNKTAKPGSFEWQRGMDMQIAAMAFTCPCGCGTIASLPVRSGYGRVKWNWDGNLERPTLTPSVRMMTKCGWHGYMMAGEWKAC